MVTSDIYRMTHLSLVCLSYSAVAVCNVCFVVVTHINISQLSFMCQLSHGNGSCSAGCPVLLSEKLHHTTELTMKNCTTECLLLILYGLMSVRSLFFQLSCIYFSWCSWKKKPFLPLSGQAYISPLHIKEKRAAAEHLTCKKMSGWGN